MIDLHTHSIFSDGELIPTELVRRARVKGYRAIAITDHMDTSNMDFIIPRMVRVADELNAIQPVRVIPGAELTHLPPELIPTCIEKARRLGALLVVVHGETLVEPVQEGTNRAAIEGGADILAHPGLIDEEDVRRAVEKGVVLELSARKGHSLSNGHVARLARQFGARLVVNTDAHSPGDLVDRGFAEEIVLAAGLDSAAADRVFAASEEIVKSVLLTGGD
ncbi:MAG: histidinol phosphate phosphatase domain-containing protein [Nitrospirae bacterium]|nr:histidinol phosphate phosphatase domain-containing protein [Nitrospirota bacterium]